MHIDRLIATAYAQVDPRLTRRTRFGVFACDPRHPHCLRANHLQQAICPVPGSVAEFLEELDELYRPLGVTHRHICGHDPGTFQTLSAALPAGWKPERHLVMVYARPAARDVNPRVRVEAVDPRGCDWLERVELATGRSRHGFVHQVSQFPRLGGEWLVARLDGEPVGATGWFIHEGVARYRRVGTVPAARGRGVATALVRHVQDHPAVRAAEALTLFVADTGPVKLYKELGFEEVGWMWEFQRDSDTIAAV